MKLNIRYQCYALALLALYLQGCSHKAYLLRVEKKNYNDSSQFLLRNISDREDIDGFLLYITANAQHNIYHYMPQKGKAYPVNQATWEKAVTGNIKTCKFRFHEGSRYIDAPFQVKPEQQDSPYDLKDETLLLNNRVVSTAGRLVNAVMLSPNKHSVAILSSRYRLTTLEPVSTLISTFAKATTFSSSPQYRHQVYDLNTHNISEPISLPDEIHSFYIQPCWSPQGHYVIYYGSGLHNIVIIPVEL